MIIDTKLTFVTDTDVSAAAGTALAGDVVDLEAAGAFIGPAMPLYLVIQVTTAFASAGAATLEFVLASDAAAAIATDGSASEHVSSGTIGYASLTAGETIILQITPGVNSAERYLGLLVVTGGATTTAGNISAFLTTDAQNWVSYPDAVNAP